MKGLGLQRRIFSLGEVSEPANSKGLLGGEEAFSNEKRQGWKPVSSLERGIYRRSPHLLLLRNLGGSRSGSIKCYDFFSVDGPLSAKFYTLAYHVPFPLPC
jgi:hypothetical protein